MPYATALTPVLLARTVINLLVASTTIPVRSSTEFAGIVTSYSKNALSAGAVLPDADVVVSATRAVTLVAFLLQSDTLTTANVFAGTVYSVVFVAAARSADPNLPVAIIYFSVIFSLKSS
jgi:hypothetical protein